MQSVRTIRIQDNGIDLAAVVHVPQKAPAPVIVCSHGLLSSKDSPKYVAVGERMSDAGFCVVRFDFSGCGESPAREGALIPARIRDLAAVLAFSRSERWSDGRIGLLGSSLGGYLSLLAANADPDGIAAVASWSAPFDLLEVRPGQGGTNAAEEQPAPATLRLGTPVSLESLDAARRVLLIHGRQDEIVAWEDSVRIYRRLKDPRELVILNTADHRFMDESWRKAATRISLDWFLRFF